MSIEDRFKAAREAGLIATVGEPNPGNWNPNETPEELAARLAKIDAFASACAPASATLLIDAETVARQLELRAHHIDRREVEGAMVDPATALRDMAGEVRALASFTASQSRPRERTSYQPCTWCDPSYSCFNGTQPCSKAPQSSTAEPVAWAMRTKSDGSFFSEIVPVGYSMFNDRMEKLRAEPWVKCGRAEIVPLYAAPITASATLYPMPTEKEIATYRDTFRAALDHNMDTKVSCASPSTDAHRKALYQFIRNRSDSASGK